LDAFAALVDAEGHLQILKQLMPNVPFEIMFDVVPEDANSNQNSQFETEME
jgi:hypothetical protein